MISHQALPDGPAQMAIWGMRLNEKGTPTFLSLLSLCFSFFELWKLEEAQGKGFRFLHNDEHLLLGTNCSLYCLPALICLPHSHGEMLAPCTHEGKFQSWRLVKNRLRLFSKSNCKSMKFWLALI